jgi:hypothetical protein
MREDMFEVIIERPRRGNWGPRQKGRPPRELDDAPRMQSMSRRRGGTKWLNENLAPLRRFLQKRVGRPWNDVHSEIAARLSLNSAVQKHVLDHVREMVELHAVIIDGVPHHLGTRGLWPISATHRGGWYVCPSTALLLRVPRQAREKRQRERQPERVVLDEDNEAWRIDGIWYRVRFASVPAMRAQLRDVLLGRGLDENGVVGVLQQRYGRCDRYAVEKKQMSRREIAALARLGHKLR